MITAETAIKNLSKAAGATSEEEDILMRAWDIIYKRENDQAKNYGDFTESMEKVRVVMNTITGLELELRHVFLFEIVQKLCREGYKPKFDNRLDLITYTAAMENIFLTKDSE